MKESIFENLDKEGIRKLTSLKTKEEILAFAKEKGFNVTDKEIESLLKISKKAGDLSLEELDKVSGGCYTIVVDDNGKVIHTTWFMSPEFPEYENDDGEYVVPWRVFYGLDED